MEKDADDFDEEDAEESVADDSELDHLIRDVEKQRRRASKSGGQEPHWRKLERVMEDKRTAELLSDFEDYDIGDDEAAHQKKAREE